MKRNKEYICNENRWKYNMLLFQKVRRIFSCMRPCHQKISKLTCIWRDKHPAPELDFGNCFPKHVACGSLVVSPYRCSPLFFIYNLSFPCLTCHCCWGSPSHFSLDFEALIGVPSVLHISCWGLNIGVLHLISLASSEPFFHNESPVLCAGAAEPLSRAVVAEAWILGSSVSSL